MCELRRWGAFGAWVLGACGETGGVASVTTVDPAPRSSEPAVQSSRVLPQRFVAVVAAKHTANVAAQVEGTLRSVGVRLGDAVQAGDPLAVIDDRPLRESVAAAQAMLQMRQAEANLAMLKAQHATDELDREERLHSEGLATGEERAAARSRAEQANAILEQVRAAAREAKALLNKAEREVEQAIVMAPIAGVVSTRFVDPGVELRLGQPIVRLVSSGSPWVRFGVPAPYRDSIGVGDRMTFSSVDEKHEFVVIVSQLAPDVDPLSQLVLGEARLARDDDRGVYPGLGGYVLPQVSAARVAADRRQP